MFQEVHACVETETILLRTEVGLNSCLRQEEDGIFWRSESFMAQSNGLQASGRGKIVQNLKHQKHA